MDSTALQRFRESLERQRKNLVDWLAGTSPLTKGLYLGQAPEASVRSRLQQLDKAIGQAEAGTLGLCTVCREFVDEELLEMDFTACVCIDHYSDDQKRRLEQDLELAHKVQKSLLPTTAPAIPGLRVSAFIQPAEIVSGDYFDFFRFEDGAHGIAVADVMGKGLPASMLVASLQASLRILVPQHNSPTEVVSRLNQLFRNNIHLIRFISLVLLKYEPASRVLSYCNAGHNPPLHLRPGNGHTVSRLTPTGPAIGLTETAAFTSASVQLEVGDALLLYSDGLTEAHNGEREEFGETRLTSLLTASHHLEPKEIISTLRASLIQHTGKNAFNDDLTIVAGRVV